MTGNIDPSDAPSSGVASPNPRVTSSFADAFAQPADIIGPVLAPREQLLWSGRPRQGFAFRSEDLSPLAFVAFFAAFASIFVYAIFHASGRPTHYGGDAIALVFFCLWYGLLAWFVISAYTTDARARAKRFYGLTDGRVLIVDDTGSIIWSCSLFLLDDINAVERGGSFGTIFFGAQPSTMGPGRKIHFVGTDDVPCFDFIDRYQDVLAQLHLAQAAQYESSSEQPTSTLTE